MTTTDPTPAEARAVGITGDRWPYGAHVDTRARRPLVDWATAGNLRYSENARCLHWIARGRCIDGLCAEGHGSRHWLDHVTGWTRDGKPAVLLAQPYGLGTDDIADLATVAEQWHLDVRIDGTGWYGYGTTFVELWAQQRSRLAKD